MAIGLLKHEPKKSVGQDEIQSFRHIKKKKKREIKKSKL